MDRKREIANDLWDIMRRVYNIGDSVVKSDKQERMLNDIVEYIDTNLSTRRKKSDPKERECLKE